MDGDASGRIKCSLANWTGIAYKIPRTSLREARKIPQLEQSGVYFLFGTDDESGKPVAYVGQASKRKNGRGILQRVEEHNRNEDKNYWTEFVALTTSNDYLGPTELSYLESTFYSMAQAAERYICQNGNEPMSGNLTEEESSELDEFIEYAELMIGALGYKVFTPYVSPRLSERLSDVDNLNSQNQEIEHTLLHGSSRKAQATGYVTAEGFVVLKGSSLSEAVTNSCPKGALLLREQHPESILTHDVFCLSPSAAAAFVTGTSVNGRDWWKSEDGRTLKELEAEELEV